MTDKTVGTALAEQNANQEVAPSEPVNRASQMISDIMKLALDPSVDAEKMKVLADLGTSLQDREAERRFRMAKHKAIMEMPSISKRGAIINHKTNTIQSRFSKFEDIDRVVRPILARHKLVITFDVDHEGQLVTVRPILSYSDGDMAFEERGGAMVLAVDTSGAKNATQGAGSSASYGKRHQMKAMLNIIEDGEDNDGASTIELTDHHLKLIDEARSAAQDGSEAYASYFKSLGKSDQGFLAYSPAPNGSTYHDANKEAALLFDK